MSFPESVQKSFSTFEDEEKPFSLRLVFWIFYGIREFGQDPDPFSLSKRAGSVVDGGILTNNGVKELECFTVLQWCIVLSHHTQDRI